MGEGANLFSIIINLIFGFVIGLMIFMGVNEVLAYGTALAEKLLAVSGYSQQMAAFGMATTAAPYIILVPIAGLIVRQLSSVRSIKGFAIFAAVVLIGIAIAFFSQGYVATVLGA